MRARSPFPPSSRRRPFAALALCTALGACAALPPLPPHHDAAAQSAPYPALIPLAPILAQAAAPAPVTTQADIPARIAALSARAAGLRGPVIGNATSARLTNALR